MKSIIGRKMGMTEVFASDGTMYPVTVVEVLPNAIVAKKTKEKDGYEALQVGYEDKKEKNISKAIKGIYAKANVTPKAHLYELKGDEIYSKNIGETVTVEIFKTGEVIDVVGTTKGHGYAGTIKRYHNHIGPKGHGSGYHRQVGSLSNNGRCNNRVIPGKTMSGHMAPHSATVLNLTIVDVNLESNYILVKGALPGPKKSIVMLRSPKKTQFGKPEVKPLIDYVAAEKAAKEAAEAAAKAEAEAKAAAEAAAKAEAEAKAAAEAAPAQEAPVVEAAPAAKEGE